MHNTLAVIILAAGQGTRMNSELPKVMHPIGDRPMVSHVIQTAKQLSPHKIYVVYGHGGDQVKNYFQDSTINWCLQAEQLGTGHAVLQALPNIRDEAEVLVLYGDVPLIQTQTLQNLIQSLDQCALSLLTVHLGNPNGYGRIIRDDSGTVNRIVEDKDTKEHERTISEINTGILAAKVIDLKRWLAKVGNSNAQGEYYLTDCVELAVKESLSVKAIVCSDPQEVMGINDKVQLAASERAYQRRQVLQLMRSGVTIRDPERIDIRGTVRAGRDVSLDINVLLEGDVLIEDNVTIGPNCIIKDSKLGAGTQIKPNSVIEQAEVGARCQIGPFTRIRPDTRLAEEVHLGNFVEIKKSTIAQASKVNHLSYIGDSQVGKRVNVGCGTITCNYDGAYKHLTQIGDDVFIGSDTQLVAPVMVGDGATIGAGSTITRNVPEHKLTLTRASQKTIDGWQRPQKQLKED